MSLGPVLSEEFTDGSLPAPGWLGFIVISLLAVAVVLLVRSMNRHVRKVPPTFDPPAGEAVGDPSASPPDQASAGA